MVTAKQLANLTYHKGIPKGYKFKKPYSLGDLYTAIQKAEGAIEKKTGKEFDFLIDTILTSLKSDRIKVALLAKLFPDRAEIKTKMDWDELLNAYDRIKKGS